MRSATASSLIVLMAVTSGSLVQAQTCAKTPQGVVSWWPAEASTEDTVGNNDGTLQDNADYASGVVGTAFDLDGSSDHVLVRDDPSLDLQELTIEGWVRLSTTADLFVAARSGSNGTFGYELGTHNSGRPRFTINGAIGAPDVWGPVSIADGDFHHLAATYRSPTANLYVDGILVARSVIPAAVVYETDSDLLIGARQFPGIPGSWPGRIDELTIYSRALCGAEIQSIFSAGSAGKCPGSAPVECPIFTDDFDLGDTGAWTTAVP